MSTRVLVVEDDEDLVFLMSALLETRGYAVETAGNGLEALERFEAHRPDLILLDLRMPVMNGPTFARELRRRHGRVTPIVVVTAADDPVRRARDIEAEGWLGKPFSPEVLFETVRRYVGAPPVTPPLGTP